MSFDASKYRFTQNWFLTSELYQQRAMLIQKISPAYPHNILEIGSYEGLSACFFSDFLLHHPQSRMICVDPFYSSSNVSTATLSNFLHNISLSQNPHKIKFCHETSRTFFTHHPASDKFDFIYIDGSHTPADVEHDMTECWKLLVPGGIMWMDDYLGGHGSIKPVMDRWQQAHKQELREIWRGYQLTFQKLP